MLRTSLASSVSAQASELGDDRRRPLVLVVDPDASARSVLEVVLVRDGFDVWSTGSGAQGLSLIKDRTPDVIVLESDLGEEDGFSFVSQVRGDLRTAGVPVLLLARQDDENVANLAEVVGVDDYVQKPAFARDIAALVRLELAKVQGNGEITFQSGQLAPAHLLRALLSCPRSGRLSLAGGRAQIEFHHGNVVDARFGKAWGLDALVRALVLTHGEWALVLGPVEQGNVFRCTLREFVQVVLPRVHAWEHVLLRSVPLDSRLGVDFARLSKSLSSMPPDVNRVVQLFDGQRTVRQVLLDSPFDESMTLEVSTRLYLMRVVLPVKAEGLPMAQKTAPRLFEPAVGPSSGESGDWFAVTVGEASAPTAVNENDGGWKATALGDPGLAELAPDVAKQIEAFNIRIEVEPRDSKPVQRAPKALTGAMRDPVVLVEAAKAPVFDEPLTPVSRHFDRQERIVTPMLTPAITEADVLEASFFSAPAVVAQARAVDPSDAEDTVAIAPRKMPLSWAVGGAAVAILMLAVVFEMLTKPMPAIEARPAVIEPVAVAVAPVMPDIEEPEFYEDVPATVIDVSGPLAEAQKKYDQGFFAQSISMLEQITADEPRSVKAWYLMGKARYDANDAKGAREAAEKVLALDANNAPVQMLLATLSLSAGDKVAEKEALQRYLTLEPNGASAEEAKALLAR